MTVDFSDKSGQNGEVFRGKHKGKVFVTTHRMVFLNDDPRDHLLSFAVAFMYMKDLRVEQPLLGANYIAGVAAAHPNGSCSFPNVFNHLDVDDEKGGVYDHDDDHDGG